MVDAARSIAANTSGQCWRMRVMTAPASLLGRCPVIPTRSVRRGFGGCWFGEESDGIGLSTILAQGRLSCGADLLRSTDSDHGTAELPLPIRTRVYPSSALFDAEVGYIRLRVERVGVRGF